jgi:lipopolysaccharide/colanic/teichoic acid biosynthesis glycosyltransferase
VSASIVVVATERMTIPTAGVGVFPRTLGAARRDAILYAATKRAIDILAAATLLLVLLPVLAVIAVAIAYDGFPVLFRQRRIGMNGMAFTLVKFRSMRADADPTVHQRYVTSLLRDEGSTCSVYKVANDPRITRVGAFLRRTSLDELPQLINVLTGEMSLVGPRPHAVGMRTGDVQSAQLVAEYAHRHRMKPGLTGWAAINGSRGPVDTPELVRRRVALDIEYIERQSFWLDLYIMVMTLPCLVGDRQAVR